MAVHHPGSELETRPGEQAVEPLQFENNDDILTILEYVCILATEKQQSAKGINHVRSGIPTE